MVLPIVSNPIQDTLIQYFEKVVTVKLLPLLLKTLVLIKTVSGKENNCILALAAESFFAVCKNMVRLVVFAAAVFVWAQDILMQYSISNAVKKVDFNTRLL